MKPEIWEFVRSDDATYAVFHKGERLADCIPERWFERTVGERWGFCGQELQQIIAEIAKNGRCVMTL